MQTAPNVSTLLDANLEAGRGSKKALITADETAWTYTDLYQAACRVAVYLQDLGVRRGERILLVLDDTPVFPSAFLGAIRMGAVPIPVNFLARPDDFGYFLDDSYAVAAIFDPPFLESVGPQLDSRPHVQQINSHDLNLRGDCEVDPVDTHPDDPAFWMYSSGSTGVPKAVVHRHASVEATCRRYAWPTLSITEEDVVFSSTKMFHAYGFGNNLTFPLSVGATSVYLTGRPLLLHCWSESPPTGQISSSRCRPFTTPSSPSPNSMRLIGHRSGLEFRLPNRSHPRSGDSSMIGRGSRFLTVSARLKCSTSIARTVPAAPSRARPANLWMVTTRRFGVPKEISSRTTKRGSFGSTAQVP